MKKSNCHLAVHELFFEGSHYGRQMFSNICNCNLKLLYCSHREWQNIVVPLFFRNRLNTTTIFVYNPKNGWYLSHFKGCCVNSRLFYCHIKAIKGSFWNRHQRVLGVCTSAPCSIMVCFFVNPWPPRNWGIIKLRRGEWCHWQQRWQNRFFCDVCNFLRSGPFQLLLAHRWQPRPSKWST